MRAFLQSTAALPFRELGRRPDVTLAFGVAFIIGMLIIPMPHQLLDVLIAVNIASAVAILMAALFAKRVLEMTSFPSLLLITTLFRLGLNVSTTRGILSHADAGAVVKAFGQFVIQGDIIVGMTIFLVVTLVQFLVIAKGAERVAEVGARFTLDAMPGKQMSIEASLRAGAIDEAEAQRKREDLGRESQMFGNMDGAMKFVKGDAIAGLIITAINLVAGIGLGIIRMDMPIMTAVETYSVLTVGDALVAQISALLVTIAAGLLVTRVDAEEKNGNLATTLQKEFGSNPKSLNVAGVLLFAIGAVPGLPAIPFFLIGGGLIAVNASGLFPRLRSTLFKVPAEGGSQVRAPALDAITPEGTSALVEKHVKAAKAQKAITDNLAPSVVPIGIDLDPKLSKALGFASMPADATELLAAFIPQLRDAIYLETGVRVPGIRVRTDCESLPESTFVVRVNDVPVVEERVEANLHIAMTEPRALKRLGVDAKAGKHPITGGEVSLVDADQVDVLKASGINVWSPGGVIALYVAGALRTRAKDFLGLQEVSDLVERLEKAYPALVREVVPKVVSLPQLVDILQRLVDEGVCVRDLKSIVEALGKFGTLDDDCIFLTEKVRAALSAQIVHTYCGTSRQLAVMLIDPAIEETIASGLEDVKGGKVLAVEPEIYRAIVRGLSMSLLPMLKEGLRPVLLTTTEIRRYVKKLVETEISGVVVLSYDELPPDLSVHPMGRATLDRAA